MEEVRCFIAIELPEALKSELKQLQARLKTSYPNVKWVDPTGIHLTLKFLGYVPADRLDDITLAMQLAVEGISPFKLEVRGLGGFPNLNRAQVIWVGLTGDVDKLGQLARSVELAMAALGYPPENRPFTPHLALARLGDRVSPEERQGLGQLVARTTFEGGTTIAVAEIDLMRSQLTRAGAIYSRISAVKLK